MFSEALVSLSVFLILERCWYRRSHPLSLNVLPSCYEGHRYFVGHPHLHEVLCFHGWLLLLAAVVVGILSRTVAVVIVFVSGAVCDSSECVDDCGVGGD